MPSLLSLSCATDFRLQKENDDDDDDNDDILKVGNSRAVVVVFLFTRVAITQIFIDPQKKRERSGMGCRGRTSLLVTRQVTVNSFKTDHFGKSVFDLFFLSSLCVIFLGMVSFLISLFELMCCCLIFYPFFKKWFVDDGKTRKKFVV